jgi:phosphopantetheinyl transferase
MWLSVLIAPAPRAELLSTPEREALARAGYQGPRRDEWIAGRLAARRALARRLGVEARDVSVLADPDGAPRANGGRAPLAISLSHDAGRVAVALRPGPGRVAVDLCARVHARRLPRLLDRLRLEHARRDACAIWAALECALKLRGLGVTALLGARLRVAGADPGAVRVSGLGADVQCRLASRRGFALAWAEEAA